MKIKKRLLLTIPIIFLLAATIAISGFGRGRVISGTERELWIEEYSTLPADPEVGFESIILQVDFKHTGTATYRNMTFRAEEPPQLESVREEFYISNMKPDDVFTTSYKFNVKENTTPGVYTVPIHIEYTDIGSDEDNKTAKITREARVRVSDETDIEIVNVEQEEPVLPGEEFKTEVEVKNIGNMPSNLLKVSMDTLAAQERTATEEEMMEEGYEVGIEEAIHWKRQHKTIDYLHPGETQTIEFTGKTSISADNKIYPAVARVEGGRQREIEKNKFTVTVEGEPRVIEGGLSTAEEEPRAGDRISISIQLENIGEGDARATTLKLEEGKFEGDSRSHIGTIDKDGGTGTAVMDLTFTEPGEHEIKYTVTYEDKTGKEYTEEFTDTVYIGPEEEDYTTLIIAAIVAIIVAFLIYRKIKKSKEAKEVEV